VLIYCVTVSREMPGFIRYLLADVAREYRVNACIRLSSLAYRPTYSSTVAFSTGCN